MKSVCLYFQIHQPQRLKKYRFFDIGKDSMYLDDYLNRSVINRASYECYAPMNELLKQSIEQYKGDFKVSFSISTLAIEQMKAYEPEVLESFKELAATGCVDFVAGTSAYSLSSLVSKDEFQREVKNHCETIEKEFGVKPTTFVNTELIYSDLIGEYVAELGFNTMVTEGAKHILGHKSPNFVYVNAVNPRLKLLLRNVDLSDDLRYRFSEESWCEYPLTAEKYADWVAKNEGDIVNVILDYETFGGYQKASAGIFDFFKCFVDDIVAKDDVQFNTPAEASKDLPPIAILHVPYTISWTGEEKDVSAWFGNDLQKDSIDKLYALKDRVLATGDENLLYVWEFLKTSNHFYFMSTKLFSDNAVSNASPYDSPYEAFINYMNVLTDFERQISEKE
ncbi:MAG: glycoside hydrolase family 57 protein [Rikenellaceae bacterium]